MRRENLDNIVKWGFLQDIFGFCFLRAPLYTDTAVLVYQCPICGQEFLDIDNPTFYEFEQKCLEHIDKCFWHSKRPITMNYIFTRKKIARR